MAMVCIADAVGVTHGDANLTDAAQTLRDQTLVAGMKRLVAPTNNAVGFCGSNAGAAALKLARPNIAVRPRW